MTTLIGAFLLVTFLTYRRIDEQLRLAVGQKLQTIAEVNAASARNWFDSKKQAARALAQSPGVAVDAHGALTMKGVEREQARQRLDDRLHSLQTAGTIAEYAVLDTSFRTVASSEPPLEGVDRLPRRLWDEVRAKGGAISPPLFRNTQAALPTRVSAIAVSVVGPPESLEGYLAFAIDLMPLSEHLHIARWGATGETYAFDANGFMLTESRFKDQLVKSRLLPEGAQSSVRFRLGDPGPLHDSTFEGDASKLPLVYSVEQATQGRSGSNLRGFRDYRGADVVGAWVWVTEYNFGIATEVDEQDAFESVAIVRFAFVTLAGLVLLAVTGFALLSRWTMRLRERSVLVSQRLDRLARSLAPLSAALENDPGAVVLVNNRLEIVYANPSAVRMFKGAPLAGSHVGAIASSLSPAVREALIEGQDTLVSQGEDDEDSVLVCTRELTIDGKLHTLYMLRPVTQELRRQEVEHWKKLIRVLSHELNNSLAPITSLVSSARKLAQDGPNSDKLDKVFSTIAERTDHLLAFLESYRSVARLPRPTRRDVPWRGFVDGLRSQFEFQLQGEIPGGAGYFDPTQMERVFVNLLKNAREAGGPPEEVALSIVEDGVGVRLDVLDRGTGMSPRVLEQAMLPFYSTKRTGTGVGLALAREIVEAHHGRLTLANREGGGLCASVWLPERTDHALSTVF
jgi:signal transduction histidine kinase